MRGTIIDIHPLKMSRTEHAFIRIEFMMEDGKWAKTDVVTRYRNYNRWKPIIQKGRTTALGNLKFRREGEVDADSYPVILTEPIIIKKEEEVNASQLKLI
jgi:hypothetical protein